LSKPLIRKTIIATDKYRITFNDDAKNEVSPLGYVHTESASLGVSHVA
jgi:hypothetical protein